MPSLPTLRRGLFVVLSFATVLLVTTGARALTLQVPVGSAGFLLPDDRLLCGAVPEGWTTDPTRRRMRPPTEKRPGTSVSVLLGRIVTGCSATEGATILLTGPFPVIDAPTVNLFADAARLELRGEGLEGARIGWRSGDKAGSDVCLNVTKDKGREVCAVNIDKKLPADPRSIGLWWAPPGGRSDPDVVTFDASGNSVAEDHRRLPVARLILNQLFPATRTVDVASGEGHVDLAHPEAVSAADCGAARCEVTATGIAVRAIPATLPTVVVRARLLPRVFLARGDAFDGTPSETLSVLRCPLTIASGPPLRSVDDLRVLVRFDHACGRELDHLRWTANGEVAEVIRAEVLPEGRFVLLHVGRASGERLTITAAREDDGAVVAVVSEHTAQAPPLQTSLMLPDLGQIDFIPKNRDALLTVSPISGSGTLVPVSVPGAYLVKEQKNAYRIQGVYASAGYAALRFVYRITSVPQAFRDIDFASLVDPVQRPIREANVPAPLGASSLTAKPIVELLCSVAKGRAQSIKPGTSLHIPFSERDSCHIVIHRDRIPAENGEQRVDLDVSVSTVNGNDRPEAKLSEHLVLRHGPGTDVIWVRGAKEQFDKISIRSTHVIDETQYMGRSASHIELPSGQWTIVTESARFRYYATAAIPTSLYRFSNDPQGLGTGPLALNFGVLSRLTWLDSDGHEGLVGLEGGVMGMGLAAENDRQLALVAGLGISIPIGNVNQPTQASVNIHGWGAYTVGERTANLKDDLGNVTGKVSLSHWAFVFGPSITIGNVGIFL